MSPLGIPDETDPRWVYSFWSESGECLYVGCTVDFARRMAAHRRERPWWHEVARVVVDVHADYATGIAAEEILIRDLNPEHNRTFTDHDTPRRSPGPTRRRNHAARIAMIAEMRASA